MDDKTLQALTALATKLGTTTEYLCAAARDCRTCAHHTYSSGGCVSALRCLGGDRYQPTQPRQLWGATASQAGAILKA